MTLLRYATHVLKKRRWSKSLLFTAKKMLGTLPVPDMEFPGLIGLELTSTCNLRCVHCPPQAASFSTKRPPGGTMDVRFFYDLMDQIDRFGPRRLSLHKNGEPLLHPDLEPILRRIKMNEEHKIYLSTNGHLLNETIGKMILAGRIDIVNVSIGAAGPEFYKKTRGNGFKHVVANIHAFLKLRSESDWKPEVIVQIIDLPGYPEMDDEIKAFKKYWKAYDVTVNSIGALTWGLIEGRKTVAHRYPCYKLWESLFVDYDGTVTACCMDWQRTLVTGHARQDPLHTIWEGAALQKLRVRHAAGDVEGLFPCRKCNYWDWMPRTSYYPIAPAVK